MVNRAAYKGEKRQKEVARQKKAEEKRLRRLAKRESGEKDDDIVDADEYLESGDADDADEDAAEEPAEGAAEST
jgi:hypothetical protein